MVCWHTPHLENPTVTHRGAQEGNVDLEYLLHVLLGLPGGQDTVENSGQCRYEDDLDEGEWFLYTGSGGRDLSGNKRVTKIQSFDQTFDKMNKALLLSCEKGLPVRVVRSYKVTVRSLPVSIMHRAQLCAYRPEIGTCRPSSCLKISCALPCWHRAAEAADEP